MNKIVFGVFFFKNLKLQDEYSNMVACGDDKKNKKMIPLCFILVFVSIAFLHSCSIHMHVHENEKRAFET